MMELKAGYKQTEVGIIPEDWEVKSMADCCSKITDGTHDTPKPIKTGIPFLTAIHIKENAIDFKGCYYLPEEIHKIIYSRCNPEKDDVLMVNIGAGIATTALVNVEYEFSLKNVALLKPNKSILIGAYLNYWQSKTKLKIINSISTGGAQPFLSLKQINKLQIAIPTKAEQNAIATALSDMDALISALNSEITKKRLIKQGAMQELLSGKKRLAGFGTNSKYKQTEIGIIPDDWGVKELDELFQFQGGSQPPKETFIFQEKQGYIRLLQIRDYKSDTYESYIPLELARRFCNEDDIMIGRYGPPIFQILNGLKGAYNVALMKAIPTAIISKKYGWFVLKQETLFQFIEKLSQRSSGQTGVDLVELKKYKIPFPPFHEQTAIAQVLSDMDSDILALETERDKTLSLKQGMMQELLTGKTRLI